MANPLQVVAQPAGLPTTPLKVAQPPAAAPLSIAKPATPSSISIAQPQAPKLLSVQPVAKQPTINPTIINADGTPYEAPAADTSALSPEHKTQLREIVGQMIQNKEPDAHIRAVVSAYTEKYAGQRAEGEPEPGYLGLNRDGFLDPNIVFGFGKGIAQSFAKLGQPLAKLVDKGYEAVTGQKPSIPLALSDEQLTAKSAPEKIGKFAGDTTQFALGSEATKPLIGTVEKTVETLGKNLPKLGRTFIKTFSRSVIAGAEGAAITKAQGASSEEAATNAFLSGVIPWGGLALNELKGIASKTGKAIEYKLIKPTQADIKDGFKVDTIFKHDLGGPLQQTAQKTNDLITSLTKRGAEISKNNPTRLDLLELLASTEKDLVGNQTRTFGMNSKLKNAFNFFADELGTVTKDGTADFNAATQIKRSTGKLGAWMYGARDPESNAIETVASAFYTRLRLALEKNASPELATINKQLTELIPVENALIRRVPIEARGNVLGLSDIINALPAVGEIKNPANWWLFALNKLSKSGRLAKTLVKASVEPTERGALKTTIFGGPKTPKP